MTSPALQAVLDAMPAERRAHDRDMLRRKAAKYERQPRDLYRWTFPPTRGAVFNAVHRPDDPAATKKLCRAIWADLQTARAMPSFFQRKAVRISVLRELFACECETYRNQKRAACARAFIDRTTP